VLGCRSASYDGAVTLNAESDEAVPQPPIARPRSLPPGVTCLARFEVLLAVVRFAVLCVVMHRTAPQLEPDDFAYRGSVVAMTHGHFLTLSRGQAGNGGHASSVLAAVGVLPAGGARTSAGRRQAVWIAAAVLASLATLFRSAGVCHPVNALRPWLLAIAVAPFWTESSYVRGRPADVKRRDVGTGIAAAGCRYAPWLGELVISSRNALCASARKAYYHGYSSGPRQLHPQMLRMWQ
jgi:hypothetical protein